MSRTQRKKEEQLVDREEKEFVIPFEDAVASLGLNREKILFCYYLFLFMAATERRKSFESLKEKDAFIAFVCVDSQKRKENKICHFFFFTWIFCFSLF